MTQTHYLPMFFGDLLASTPTWDGEERALYMMLLAYQWTAGALPVEPKKIAKMCQYDVKGFMALWATVGKKFVQADDGLINLRLEEHRQKAIDVSNKRALAGAKGGAKNKQREEQTESKTEAIADDLYSHPILSNPIQSQESDSRRGEAPSVDQAIYADARKVFGQSIGGQIGKAIKNHGKPWIVGVIESCRTKDQEQARAYLAAALKGAEKPDAEALRRRHPG